MGSDTTRGVRVRLAVPAAEACPVADATTAGATARSVEWSRAGSGPTAADRSESGRERVPDGGATGVRDPATPPSDLDPGGESVVEEFDLVGGGDAELPEDATVVFAADETRRVRFERDDRHCICDRVERAGCLVTDVGAEGGTLFLTFYATDAETVRSVVADLNDAYGSVRIDSLSHSSDGGDDDWVAVDRGCLTDRQREVLETALEMGYFQRPREANASEVADELDIAPSTFAEHLATAQAKVLDSLLGST